MCCTLSRNPNITCWSWTFDQINQTKTFVVVFSSARSLRGERAKMESILASRKSMCCSPLISPAAVYVFKGDSIFQ